MSTLPKVITIDKGNVVIDENIYTIPEFKNLWKKTKSSVPFHYIWAMYDPESPYMNLTDEEREEQIKKDILTGEKFDRDSVEFSLAMKRAEKLYDSPIRKLMRGAKVNIDNLAMYLETVQIEHGRDGNLNTLINLHKNLLPLIKNFSAVESEYRQVVSRARGNAAGGLGEDD